MSMKTLAVAIAAASLAAGAVQAADHREAPLIAQNPSADIGDVYAFRNPMDGDKLVLILTVNPFAVKEEAVTYHFSPNVRYRINIDNTGDAVADHRLVFDFTPVVPGPQMVTARLPNGVELTGATTAPTEEPTANSPTIIEGPNGIKVFAGPTDDPFFFDVVGFLRFLSGTGIFTGSDGFGGKNVSSIVAEIPVSSVAGSSGQLQIWADTNYRQIVLTSPSAGRVQSFFGPYIQVDRTGNPTVNTVLVPASLKDAYNASEPKDDVQFAAVQLQSLQSFGTSNDNIATLASVALPDTLKLDLSQDDGYPNGRRLDDDVVDTLLTLILNAPVADLVDANDKPFNTTFPYLAAPHQPE